MKAFTSYKKNDDGKEVKAVFWDGNYEVYTFLVHEEPNFVGVLDDSGQKGKDRVKLWNEKIKSWETCQLGSYIIKTDEGIFTVKSRDEVLSELSPVR